MADGASSAQSGASSASSAQTNSTGVTYSLASLAPPTPEQPSYLDKIDNFVRSAQMYEHLTNYASARQCYEAAADTMMDMVEAPDCKCQVWVFSPIRGCRAGYRVVVSMGVMGLRSVLSLLLFLMVAQTGLLARMAKHDERPSPLRRDIWKWQKP